MHEEKNRGTQPFRQARVFANWEVIARGWYVALASRELARGDVRSIDLCGQRIAFFRGEDGKVRALDAFCPHMGTDLGIGTVIGNTVRCFFHQWRYDETGACVEIPCQDHIPGHARLRAYAVEEKYGYVWIYPDAEAPYGVVELPELEGQEVVFTHDPPRDHSCHQHVTMINGIDAQHLSTVHRLNFAANVEITERPERHELDFVVRCKPPEAGLLGTIWRRLLGDDYAYGMRYADGCVGALTTLKDVRLFGKTPLPTLHMIFAYTPIARDVVRTYGIYVARKRRGPLGFVLARLLMWLQRVGFNVLRGDDAKIYDNIRFQPNALLPIDEPVGRYFAWVNRLEPSAWSTDQPRKRRLTSLSSHDRVGDEA